MKDKNKNNQILSVANLPSEFLIDNTRNFISEMRSKFLNYARGSKGLSLEEVCEKCDCSIEELKRIETGIINEKDMMLLHDLSELYEVNYFSLLKLYRLAEHNPEFEYGLAAYHDESIDKNTQKELVELLQKLNGLES